MYLRPHLPLALVHSSLILSLSPFSLYPSLRSSLSLLSSHISFTGYFHPVRWTVGSLFRPSSIPVPLRATSIASASSLLALSSSPPLFLPRFRVTVLHGRGRAVLFFPGPFFPRHAPRPTSDFYNLLLVARLTGVRRAARPEKPENRGKQKRAGRRGDRLRPEKRTGCPGQRAIGVGESAGLGRGEKKEKGIAGPADDG